MSNIKITPCRKRMSPGYPDQYSVQLAPLLLGNRPLRWNAVPVAGMVLSAVVMLGLAGCKDVPRGDSAPVAVADSTPTPAPVATANLTPTPAPVSETPLFEHGEGIGVYGCVAVSAPVFLSEDDAFAVIKDEFEKRNLSVREGGGTVENIQIPMVDLNGSTGGKNSGVSTQTGDLSFDFVVQDRNIAMEFVSYEDMHDWRVKKSTFTVSIYDYKTTAQALNASLNDASLGNTHVVFYDPVETINMRQVNKADDWDSAYAQLEAEGVLRASDVLREQVRDFIDWLAAQGII